jgi:uncharacterized membrane protein
MLSLVAFVSLAGAGLGCVLSFIVHAFKEKRESIIAFCVVIANLLLALLMLVDIGSGDIEIFQNALGGSVLLLIELIIIGAGVVAYASIVYLIIKGLRGGD